MPARLKIGTKDALVPVLKVQVPRNFLSRLVLATDTKNTSLVAVGNTKRD
jgi:hypothetical protein